MRPAATTADARAISPSGLPKIDIAIEVLAGAGAGEDDRADPVDAPVTGGARGDRRRRIVDLVARWQAVTGAARRLAIAGVGPARRRHAPRREIGGEAEATPMTVDAGAGAGDAI